MADLNYINITHCKFHIYTHIYDIAKFIRAMFSMGFSFILGYF